MRTGVSPDRASALVELLCRFDALKRVERSDYVGGTNRRENPAEHTWHALLVLMTYRYVSGDTTIDYAKAYELLIVHDLPEIIAGDIPIFDEPTIAIAHARERAGLTELVSNTDPDFATIISQHWEEFEALASAEAKLAKVSDRFQPMLQNLSSSGRGWQERSVTLEQIERITGIVREHSDFFATLLMAMLQAAERGKFLPRPSEKSTPL